MKQLLKIIVTFISIAPLAPLHPLNITELPNEVLDILAQYTSDYASSLAIVNKKFNFIIEGLRAVGKLPYPYYHINSDSRIAEEYSKNYPHNILNRLLQSTGNFHTRALLISSAHATKIPVSLLRYTKLKKLHLNIPKLGQNNELPILLKNNLTVKCSNYLESHYGVQALNNAISLSSDFSYIYPNACPITIRGKCLILELEKYNTREAFDIKDKLNFINEEIDATVSLDKLTKQLSTLTHIYHNYI